MTSASASAPASASRLDVLINVFVKTRISLTPEGVSFDKSTAVRYWSKVLQSNTPSLLSDLDVKVMDVQKSFFSDRMF